MRQIWIITKKELGSFFDSLMAYIMLILFLGFSGFFTWIYGTDIFLINQASLQSFFGIAFWTLFFFIPALTMRSLAEEKKSGTIELLLTKPITEWQLVLGKFFSTLILISIALLLTLPYYITISFIGPIDHGVVWSGYIGLILISAIYISIGIFCSSITNNQIVAFLLTISIGILFHLLFTIISSAFPGIVGETFNYLSVTTHFESISRGVIDTKDLIYFASITFLGLAAAKTQLQRRKA